MALVRRFGNDLSNLPRTIRIAQEYQRSLVYGIVGVALGAGLIYALRGLLPERQTISFGVFAFVVLLGCVSGLCWKLVVDVDGLWVRRFPFVWDQWRWEAFALGQIADPEGCSGFARVGAPGGARN